MDVLLPAALIAVLLGSSIGASVYGALWLWSLPWHADDEAAE